MKKLLGLAMLASILFGCAGRSKRQTVYYDLESINHIPGMIWATLMRPGEYGKRQHVQMLGSFGTSAIEIASRTVLDTPLIVTWFDTNKVNHERPFPFHILPPLDTANQKYHLRFTFYPGDSVKIQARAVAKSSCRHILDHGATAFAAFGPCISDDGYSKTLDSIRAGLVHHPWKGPMDIPGWD